MEVAIYHSTSKLPSRFTEMFLGSDCRDDQCCSGVSLEVLGMLFVKYHFLVEGFLNPHTQN